LVNRRSTLSNEAAMTSPAMHQPENDPAKVWKIMNKVKTCMFTTHHQDGFDARPFHAYVEEDEGAVIFMTGADSRAIADVSANPRVLLTFAGGTSDFAAVEGMAAVENDRAKIKDLWNPWAEAFWDGPDDPRVRLIRVAPSSARYWDAPNAVVSTVQMLAAAVSGKPLKMGEMGEVKM
jgi:general stress protein 26